MMEKPPVANENGGASAPEKSPAPEVTPAPKAKSKPDYVLWVGVAVAIALIVFEIAH